MILTVRTMRMHFHPSKNFIATDSNCYSKKKSYLMSAQVHVDFFVQTNQLRRNINGTVSERIGAMKSYDKSPWFKQERAF